MLSYRATLDVPVTTARTVSRWITAHRRHHDARPWQRAATSWAQAVMLLRWLIEAPAVTTVARDAGVSPATAYRYLHEALDVVSSKAPDLPDVLRTLKDKGEPFVCLDGTLIRTDRVAERDPDTGYHLWYSGKHKAFGGNVQVLTDHTGYPVWTSQVEPGSTHDIEAARAHVLPALYPVAAQGMATLADKGYVGAGIGIKTPIKGSKPDTGARSYNQVQASLRAPAERANALLKGFKALKRVTLDPATITNITATALVILNLNNNLP
ncbi:IS5/IS1182 family transposase [Actinomyces sp. 432]|uniref:transposase family protein n=1 Tax=Actinomyces sp. 432 TaxID=2057798 RepID=UPI001373CC8B|nr:transposase family protein [Actinomyces sp. 432]QHO90539.1 IS5/IS1182 family transposase [Actinomyces sp. 432]QHO90883.1 IS5/IS1182 family transposase [Actinomyces sp. 432]QHO91166.1 IS5/IS1182 family transposase [Actinomyces sp. 432]